MHVQRVQKYCFPLSNMQIWRIFVAVVVVVALSSLISYHNDNNVTWKCNFSFLQLFLEYFKSFDLENVPWLSWN